jgi:hypothetical protein
VSVLHKGHINGDEHRQTNETLNRRNYIMIRKTLIAAATVSAIALSFGATSAKADSIDIGLGFGAGGITTGSFGFHGGHHYAPSYYDAGYDDGCDTQMVRRKVWNRWHTRRIWVWKRVEVCGDY